MIYLVKQLGYLTQRILALNASTGMLKMHLKIFFDTEIQIQFMNCVAKRKYENKKSDFKNTIAIDLYQCVAKSDFR